MVHNLFSFLDDVSPRRPIRYLEKDLQAVGISTLAELMAVAPRPEEFRARIPVLAGLRETDQYLWMMFEKKLTDMIRSNWRKATMSEGLFVPSMQESV